MSSLPKKILIANRSEIAVRVIHACRTLNIPAVAVYSDADSNSKHRIMADESVHIGNSPPLESYLNIEKIISAAKATGADAIHPGYGFLAENPDFAQRCSDKKIKFIGPSPQSIRLMGDKVESRKAVSKAGVPVIPGMDTSATDIQAFYKAAAKVGYPVLIKAAAGGGGKGMRIVNDEKELPDLLEAARREAQNAFGDDRVYLEKVVLNPRHIEFQILGDEHGNTIHLFERECSIQRRHQKIIEETPSVALDDKLRERMGADAVRVAKAANYSNAGTVEFLLDQQGQYYYLEMNTRLQVEHPITEMVTGTDMVVEQIRIASGLKLNQNFQNAVQRGHAVECRIYAEDGDNSFMPSTGDILFYHEPSGPGVRVDSGVLTGSKITIDYDPIMAKLIVHAPDRTSAISKMKNALNNYKIIGVKTPRHFLVDVLQHPEFVKGRTFTNFIETNMSDRKVSPDSLRELAVAAAAVLSTSQAKAPAYTEEISGGVIPTPWHLLGDWTIGSSINE